MPDEYYDLLAEMQEEEIAMQSFAEEHELEVMWDLLQDSQYVSIRLIHTLLYTLKEQTEQREIVLVLPFFFFLVAELDNK